MKSALQRKKRDRKAGCHSVITELGTTSPMLQCSSLMAFLLFADESGPDCVVTLKKKLLDKTDEVKKKHQEMRTMALLETCGGI